MHARDHWHRYEMQSTRITFYLVYTHSTILTTRKPCQGRLPRVGVPPAATACARRTPASAASCSLRGSSCYCCCCCCGVGGSGVVVVARKIYRLLLAGEKGEEMCGSTKNFVNDLCQCLYWPINECFASYKWAYMTCSSLGPIEDIVLREIEACSDPYI